MLLLELSTWRPISCIRIDAVGNTGTVNIGAATGSPYRFSFLLPLEMGMKWFQHPETKVSDQFTDVRQFLQESSLTLEVDAEMEAVADTFRGVENLHGVFHWEGSSGNQQAKNEQKRHKHVEEFANDHTFRANLVLQDAYRSAKIHVRSAENWVKPLCESQRTRLLNYLWKLLPQKTTSSKHSIELIEFARDLGNANSRGHPSNAIDGS